MTKAHSLLLVAAAVFGGVSPTRLLAAEQYAIMSQETVISMQTGVAYALFYSIITKWKVHIKWFYSSLQ